MLKTIFSSIALASLALAPLSAEARSRCGLASFYGGDGDGFAGKTMANGRPMNPWAMITAHRSLPLGSKIKVTNRANGKTVILRVTDRGPYAYDRVLDLSYGAFAKLARPSQGLASVCYTVVWLRGALAPFLLKPYDAKAVILTSMDSSLVWAYPLYYGLRTSRIGEYYFFVATNETGKRYRIHSDISNKPRLVHFIAAIDDGRKIWMPIFPDKKMTGIWRVSLDDVDKEPPSIAESAKKKSAQLSFVQPPRNFSSMENTKKQTYVISSEYAQMADDFTKRFNYTTKSDFLANVVANHLDMLQKMDAIC